MFQGERLYGVDIRSVYPAVTPPRGMGTGSAQPDQISPQAIDARGVTTLGNLVNAGIVQGDLAEQLTGRQATLTQGLLQRLPLLHEALWVSIKGQAAADDFGPRRPVRGGGGEYP